MSGGRPDDPSVAGSADPVELASKAQRRAADPRVSAWVSASAGSGKTKLLVDRLLRLLLAGTPPTKILCLTYTRAAAAEMRNRVDATLALWAAAKPETLREALKDLTGDWPTNELQERARQLFASLLDAPGGMRIETIHAFCQSLLARFPLEAGVAPHFRVIEERDADELREALREEVLARAREGRDPTLVRALEEVTARVGSEAEFDELMKQLMGERRRLEALGSGTGGLGAAVKRLRRHLGLKPEETAESIARAAFADAALDRAGLARAAAALQQGSATDGERGRALAAWLDSDLATRLATREDYEGVFFTGEGGPRAKLATKAVAEADPAAPAVLAVEQNRLMAVRQRLNAAEIATATEALLTLGRAVLAAYEERKARMAALDYDDLVAKARDLLRRPGTAPWVLYKLDGGIDHILIDEAQDTAPEQWDIVAAIAEEFFVGEGARGTDRTVFAVGDAKQSIYSFQRADPEGFRRMREHFRTRLAALDKPLVEVPLTVSFRSVPAVLKAVDAVFALDAARAGVAEADETVSHMSARPGQAGRVELWPLAKTVKAEEPAPWAPPVETIEADEPQARLARHLARRIAAMIGRDELPSRGRKVAAGDIMVLVRRRNAFVDELVRALKEQQVEVAGVDRLKLGQHIAVMDLVALGQFLLMPEDDLTLATVLKSPLIGLDEAALFTLAYERKGESLWRRLDKKAAERADFAKAHDLLSALLAVADYLPPFEIYAELLGARGGRQRMLARLGPDAADPIEEFLRLALDYARSHPPSLQGFLAWFAAGEIEVKRDLDQGAGGQVRIMTVHGAKGLQAPIVILPDTAQVPKVPGRNERILWSGEGVQALPLWVRRAAYEEAVAAAARAEREAAAAREYRRLLYVALTRAEDRLYLCGWKARSNSSATPSWYDHATAALAGMGGALVFDPGLDAGGAEGWEGPARVLELTQTAAKPDRTEEGAILTLPGLPLPDWTRAAAPREPEPWRPVAPSRPVLPEPGLMSPLTGAPERVIRFRRGLLIHRLLQTLPDLAPSRRRAAAERLLKRPVHGLDENERVEILDRVMGLLARPEFSPIWSADARAEQPIAGEIEGRDGKRIAIAGQIDRFAVRDDGIWIVDFKTNRPSAATLEEVPVAYLRQMAAYRALIGDIYPGRPIACYLLWTETPALMRLPDDGLDRHRP
ncbi:MAG: double-strand break repair helicase AddA [Pseudomonadota bacterium]